MLEASVTVAAEVTRQFKSTAPTRVGLSQADKHGRLIFKFQRNSGHVHFSGLAVRRFKEARCEFTTYVQVEHIWSYLLVYCILYTYINTFCYAKTSVHVRDIPAYSSLAGASRSIITIPRGHFEAAHALLPASHDATATYYYM